MFKLYRNSDVGKTIVQYLLVIVLGALFLVNIFNIYQQNVNEKIVQANYALIGGLVNEHPELEKDIVKYFTKELDYTASVKGQNLLEKHGYTMNMDYSYNKALKSTYLKFAFSIIFIFIVISLIVFWIIQSGFKRLYEKVSNITMVANKVVDGEYLKLQSQYEEGEIAVLTNCFNNMVDSLDKNITLLKREKVFLNNLISDISHQLKTPLASLIIFNDLLSDFETLDENILKDCLESSREQLNRMEWLILNLLKLAKLQAGAIKFKEDICYLDTTIKSAVAPFKVILENKNQELIITGDRSIVFKHDLEWTSEALSNLIKNSIEHSKDNSKILMDFYENPMSITIKIVDEGKGIKKKDLPRIFDRFYRGKNPAHPNSIGIGLALTKSIVEGQGGEIKVYSEEGVGTTFVITMYKEDMK